MASTETLTQKWLRQNVQPYLHSERLYHDIDTALARFQSLRPKSDVYTYDDGRTQLLLCIHGLLVITFRNASYNIPIAIWLTREYPRLPPIAYVVPTNDMLIKAGRFVDVSGKCEIEYIQNWARKSEGCNISALLEAMQDHFSREPPVYAKPQPSSPVTNSQLPVTTAGPSQNTGDGYRNRPPPPLPGVIPAPLYTEPSRPAVPPRLESSRYNVITPPVHPPLPPPPPRSDIRPPQYKPPAPPPILPAPPQYLRPSGGTLVNRHASFSPDPEAQDPMIQPMWSTPSPPPVPSVDMPPRPFQAVQPTLALPHQIPPHQPQQAEVTHPAPNLLDEDSPENLTHILQISSVPAPPRPPNPELLRLHGQVFEKLTSEIRSLSQGLALDAERLRAHQMDLLSGEPAIRDEMARLEAVRDVCHNVAGRLKGSVHQAEINIAELRRKGDPEVDELVCSTTIVHNQLISLVAEDNAIEDTIFHLHRALNAGRIDLERFLRSTRLLAEEQFMKRALIEKIQTGIPMGVYLRSDWS